MFVYTIDNTITGEYLEFDEEAEPFVRQCWEKVIADTGKMAVNRGKINLVLGRGLTYPRKSRAVSLGARFCIGRTRWI